MSSDPWFVPDWPVPPGVGAICTLRGAASDAGASQEGWAYFNLGMHVQDAAGAVAANRARLTHAWNMRPVFMTQIHGSDPVVLNAQTPETPRADAAVTTEYRRACTIMVADCLPVLLSTTDGHCVAAAHAGWRGLSGGVLEAALACMGKQLGQSAADVAAQCQAWLGPCIGPSEFEVGQDVLDAFMALDASAVRHFRAGAREGKYLADLAGLARQRLQRAGVWGIYGNDGSRAWCTVLNPERYYSYRRAGREGRATGRFAACIWRI